jgi:hypothetical protein
MIGTALETVKVFVTAAAAYVPLPAWLAVIEQVPAATAVSVLPVTVQTPVVVDAKLTARLDEAVADSTAVAPTFNAAG